MHILADLCTGSNGRPGIDERAAVNVGPDVDVARHQHDVACHVGALADERIRHDAHAGLLEIALPEVRILQRDLVEEIRMRSRHDFAVIEMKTQEHRFFEPLVDRPVATRFFGDAYFTTV